MLVNDSYNLPEINEKIDTEVGKQFGFKARWKLKGNGSPKLTIINASTEINTLLALDQNTNTCNIEMRPKGIIIRFRSLLETFAFVIPYYKLNIYKGESHSYTIYKDQNFVKVKATTNVHPFIEKVLGEKALQTPENPTLF
ncbi:hypothetical protein SAMN05216480_101716 [Pustulibacterium marinum]|uniref:Uncharacterized protein n=1 Tax=Pustulibacterium marinum TaxID=1224947 RepID=A0A1I7F7Q4_9FLAO|nr:hypothetical protein [Pustulibacterium marinum]SFU32207.1 hypothetical protein SAMN05216480_101716 [Pustulibacterium marinum]